MITAETFCLVGLSRLKLNSSLADYLRRCAAAARRGETLTSPPTTPSVYTAPKRYLRDRLSSEQIAQLLGDYQAGTPRRVLAEQYDISVKSVGRLAKRHGLRLRGSSLD